MLLYSVDLETAFPLHILQGQCECLYDNAAQLQQGTSFLDQEAIPVGGLS